MILNRCFTVAYFCAGIVPQNKTAVVVFFCTMHHTPIHAEWPSVHVTPNSPRIHQFLDKTDFQKFRRILCKSVSRDNNEWHFRFVVRSQSVYLRAFANDKATSNSPSQHRPIAHCGGMSHLKDWAKEGNVPDTEIMTCLRLEFPPCRGYRVRAREIYQQRLRLRSCAKAGDSTTCNGIP